MWELPEPRPTRSSIWSDRHPLSCDGSTHGLRVHLELAAQLHGRATDLVAPDGLLCFVQSPDFAGARERRGVRDGLSRSGGGCGTVCPACVASRRPRRQRPARRFRRRSEKFEPSQVSEQTDPESPQHRIPAATSMSGTPLATSAHTVRAAEPESSHSLRRSTDRWRSAADKRKQLAAVAETSKNSRYRKLSGREVSRRNRRGLVVDKPSLIYPDMGIMRSETKLQRTASSNVDPTHALLGPVQLLL